MKNTAKIKVRRKLRFESPDEALRDTEQLLEFEAQGRLEALGNWTLGQTLGHLATWQRFSYEKPPLPAAPLPIKLVLKLFKHRIVNRGMPAGMKMRGTSDGTIGTQAMSADEGMARYRAGWERLLRDPPTQPSNLFGVLTHDEAVKLNLRHAELHQSFFREGKA